MAQEPIDSAEFCASAEDDCLWSGRPQHPGVLMAALLRLPLRQRQVVGLRVFLLDC